MNASREPAASATGASISLPAVVDAAMPAALGADLGRAGQYARADKAAATRRAYRSDFAIFEAWCVERGAALPASPATVAAFLAAEASRVRPSTIGRRVAAIRYAHKLAGHPTPTDRGGA